MSPALPTILRQQGLPSPYRINGLQAYYDAKEASSLTYTAATGATSLMADLSGNSNTNVVNFNGTAQCSVANGFAFGTGDLTIALWVTFAAINSGSDQYIFTPAAAGCGLVQKNGTQRLSALKASTGYVASSSSSNLSAQTRYFVAYVRSGTTGTYYLNGVADGTTADSFDYTGVFNGVGLSFAGNIQNVWAYARALSAGEIASAYAAGPYGTAPATSQKLIPTVPLTRGAATITDTSGNSATITLPASGVWISGARDLAQVTGANQPIYLPFSGTQYGWLPGVSGNYFSTPDAAANKLTGNIRTRAKIQLPSYSAPSAAFWVGGKWDTSVNKRQYGVYIDTSGNVVFCASVNGGGLFIFTSSASLSTVFSANQVAWIRTDFTANDGAGNKTCAFYTSSDGSTWSALGSTQTSAGAVTLFNGDAGVYLGWDVGGTKGVGNTYRFMVSNGLNDTAVLDFNPAETTDGSSSWTASTGEVWTVNVSGGKPALIVGRPGVLFDGSAFYLKSAPFALNQPTWVVFIGKQLTFSNNACLFAGNVNGSTLVFQDTTTPNISLYSGSTVATNTGLALKTTAVVTAVFNGASSSLNINNGVATTGNPGVANAGGFTVGVNGGGATGFANILVNAVAVFSTAPTAADLRKLVQYFGKRWAITV